MCEHPKELRGTSAFPYFLRFSEAMMDDLMEPLELERDAIKQMDLNYCDELD